MIKLFQHKRYRLALLAGVVGLLAISSASHSASQGGGLCKAEITTSATNKSKSKAMSAAIEKWQADARKAHTASYSNWDKAKSKSDRCMAVAGKWPKQTFTCVVAAKPCQ